MFVLKAVHACTHVSFKNQLMTKGPVATGIIIGLLLAVIKRDQFIDP